MNNWQSMDTAPKDGSVIIGWIGVPWLFAWVEEIKEEKILVPTENKRWFQFWPIYSMQSITKCYWHGVVPYENTYGLMWIRNVEFNQPTHWMPLPESPIEAAPKPDNGWIQCECPACGSLTASWLPSELTRDAMRWRWLRKQQGWPDSEAAMHGAKPEDFDFLADQGIWGEGG